VKYLSLINLTLLGSAFVFAGFSDAQSATQRLPLDTIERPRGVIDGQNTVFSLQSIPDAAYPMAVFIDGQPQGSVRMTAVAKQVEIHPPPSPGSQVMIRYREAAGKRPLPDVRSLTNVLGGSGDFVRQLAAEALEREYAALVNQSGPSRLPSSDSSQSLQRLKQRLPDARQSDPSDQEDQSSTGSAATIARSVELLRRRAGGRRSPSEGSFDGLGDVDECDQSACDAAKGLHERHDDTSIPASLQRLRAISAAHSSEADSKEPGTAQTRGANHE
jgi:hypothetical protein